MPSRPRTDSPHRHEGPAGPARLDRDEARRVWGQNFFRSAGSARRFARQLTGAESAGDDSVTVEVGPGAGRITKELVRDGHPIVAVEVDPHWADRLAELELPNLTVVNDDFTTWPLPDGPLRFIGNLPFGTGTRMLRRCLALGPDRCREGVFLLQKQYTRKRTGAYGGNLFNAQWEPWYTFRRGLGFPRQEFAPVPGSDTETLLVRSRPRPLAPWSRHAAYQRFVEDVFNTSRLTIGEAARALDRRAGPGWLRGARVPPGLRVKDITAEQWADLFHACTPPPARRISPQRRR
ncbi:23S rRNA (adenine(2058)-N(6))-methyltransferase Erm(N) [Streptomyces xinghaiensis]|uniref:23S rRNA (adenine(2058)-N(6))-methyltransferase Erm(N) n=1 Tax=Streptomyces xinghaiensis TaxID=1038928 RepID=UPI00379ED49D